eukprot:GFUD01034083.1.p1 GENE.GFUD01034083.1~~GFUD01034083.1.p1  ORF type:complete len:304 (+),score=85.79 GFUD01034083.1:36-947(+)
MTKYFCFLVLLAQVKLYLSIDAPDNYFDGSIEDLDELLAGLDDFNDGREIDEIGMFDSSSDSSEGRVETEKYETIIQGGGALTDFFHSDINLGEEGSNDKKIAGGGDLIKSISIKDFLSITDHKYPLPGTDLQGRDEAAENVVQDDDINEEEDVFPEYHAHTNIFKSDTLKLKVSVSPSSLPVPSSSPVPLSSTISTESSSSTEEAQEYDQEIEQNFLWELENLNSLTEALQAFDVWNEETPDDVKEAQDRTDIIAFDDTDEDWEAFINGNENIHKEKEEIDGAKTSDEQTSGFIGELISYFG